MISEQELLDFLGVDEDSAQLVSQARTSALERLRRATGVDWENAEENALAAEAVKTMVYLSFYGVRDGLKNPAYLEDHLTGLLVELQLSKEAMDRGDDPESPDPLP